MRMSYSILGIIIFAAVALLVIGGIVALIVALATRKKDSGDLTPVGDSGISGEQKSYFDGGFFGYIGHQILYCLMSVFSLGIAVPWAICMMERWKINHTVVNGRRLKFTGTGGQLFGKYILGIFLSVITFGIYSIWFGLSIEKWKVSHTVYADDPDENASQFTGGAGGWFGYYVLFVLLSVVTFGIGMPFAMVMLERWKAENTVIGGSPLVFKGSGGSLFGRMILWGLLSVVTFGIFDLFVYVKYLRWEKANTFALYRTPEYKDFSREQEKFATENVSAYGFAANNTELDKLRSGIKGDETLDEIKVMAQGGNIYASYIYARELMNSHGHNDEEAVEMLRISAYGGYHQAMLHYAYYVKSYSEQEFVDLVKGAAKSGNFEATRILKEYYENLAYELKDNNDERCVDALRESAYWFKVAVSLGNYANEDVTYEYEKMLDTIALWKATTVEPKKGGAGVVIGAILGVIALIGVLGVGAFAIMAVFGLTVPVSGIGFGKVESGVVSPAPYEDGYYDDYYDDGFDYEEVTENNYGYVPYLEGLTEADAIDNLEAQGFICEVTYTETSDYPEGTVISCSHSEGEYYKGETVTLEIAIAPQYPELTRDRAFELIDNAYTASGFMCNYFGGYGMMDYNDVYDYDMNGEGWTIACGSVSGVKTKADLKEALSVDFTDEYIDNVFMVAQPNSDSSVLMYEGQWFEANGKIYCMPNEFVGFYSVYEETVTIEELEPGKYVVRGKAGAPTLDDCGDYAYTVVYVDGTYKIDY